VTFGDDLEKHLSFIVDARRALANLDGAREPSLAPRRRVRCARLGVSPQRFGIFHPELRRELRAAVDVVTLARPTGVTKTLVMTALALVARCNCRVGGKHTRRTTNFVKACLAFAHVTIPAVGSDKVWQLHAFLLAGQAALSTGLLSHTDSLLKASIRPHACQCCHLCTGVKMH